MPGMFSGLRDKVLAATGIEDKAADALKQLLASQGGQAGLEALMKQCDQAGIGDKARSWVGDGPKQPLTTEEVQRLLTSDQARFMASCTGLPLAPLLPVLAKLLPVVMAKMAKQGEGAGQAVDEALAEEKGAPAAG